MFPLPKMPGCWHNKIDVWSRVVTMMMVVGLVGCRGRDEVRASKMCEQAESLEKKGEVRAALELKRKILEGMPTAGTVAAKRCLRPVRSRMGRVRLLVREDQQGEKETIDGCAWAADVVEVFHQSVRPPFRRHWAGRLMAQCVVVVGRAWTRSPDSRRLRELSDRLKRLETLE